jgi:hypothetical protein
MSIADRKLERLASLRGLKFAEHGLGWTGVTPDGSLISTRDVSSSEIYAFDWTTR